MFNVVVKISQEDKLFLDSVNEAMQAYFGDDRKRIDHALQVSLYAQELLTYIDADPVVVLTAAYLHDIGIHEAERKHGSSSGKWQEIEGPPIAEGILRNLKAEEGLLEHVISIVAKHHSRCGVDSPEFRIIWDADAMVNFAEILPGKGLEQVEEILHKHMVTESGFRIARRLFVKGAESHKQLFRDGLNDVTGC